MTVFMKQWYQFNNSHTSKTTNHSAYSYCNPNKPKSQNDCLVISTRWWQQCKTRVLWSHVLCNHLRRTYRRLFLLNISGVTAVGDDPPQIDLPPSNSTNSIHSIDSGWFYTTSLCWPRPCFPPRIKPIHSKELHYYFFVDIRGDFMDPTALVILLWPSVYSSI